MAKATKKSAGPFVLWPELTRDDSYRLRSAFNPDKAEYVAHMEDGINLDTVPLASDALPDMESQDHLRLHPSTSANPWIKRIIAALIFLGLGIAGSYLVLRNRPSEQPDMAPHRPMSPEKSGAPQGSQP